MKVGNLEILRTSIWLVGGFAGIGRLGMGILSDAAEVWRFICLSPF